MTVSFVWPQSLQMDPGLTQARDFFQIIFCPHSLSVPLIQWYTGNIVIGIASLKSLGIKHRTQWRRFHPCYYMKIELRIWWTRKLQCTCLYTWAPRVEYIYVTITCTVDKQFYARARNYIFWASIFITESHIINTVGHLSLSTRLHSSVLFVKKTSSRLQRKLSWWSSNWSNWITRKHLAASSRARCRWHLAEIFLVIFLCCFIIHPTCVENKPREISRMPGLKTVLAVLVLAAGIRKK
jgi:hypothetical protein